MPQVDMLDKTFTSLLGIIAVRDSSIAISTHAPLYTSLFIIVAILAPTWVIGMEIGQFEASPRAGTFGGGGLQERITIESVALGIAPHIRQERWIPLRKAP
jgi:hypothetical protein